MTNKQISVLLKNVAAAYTIKDEKKFRFQIIAYQKAAAAIDNSIVEVSDLFKENKLGTIPGVGPTIKNHLEELIKSGKVKHFEWVFNGIPTSVFSLIQIPSFGPKTAFKLVQAFKLNNPKTVIDNLKSLARKGKIAKLPSFGDKSEKEILQAISEFGKGKNRVLRMTLPFASEIADRIIDYMKESKDVLRIEALGSLRRQVSTIGDIDLAVSTNNPKAVMIHFTAYPYKERIIDQGDVSGSILISGGHQIDIKIQPPDRFGSLLQHFTGSKNHNIHLREYAIKKGLSLSEYGIKSKKGFLKTCSSEEDFYHFLGMEWIPPEMREDTGEIELAIKKKLPKLIKLSDIKGDLHTHSNFPIEPSHDLGKDSMEQMLILAGKLGYSYLGFTEHNPSISKHSNKQIYEILKKKKEKIEQLNSSKEYVRSINMLEVDILPNGNLSIDPKTFDLLDAVVVSIHSSFSLNKGKMTERVISGLSHDKAKIFAHPTGRIINERQGYDLDWEKLLEFCKKNNKALEINSYPLRLDLPDNVIRMAVDSSVKMSINTDSHELSQLSLMKFGVSLARRGWTKKDDIVNTLAYNELIDWFNK